MKVFGAIWGVAALLGAGALIACGGRSGGASRDERAPSSARDVSASPTTTGSTIRWKAPDGTVRLELKPKGGDYKLYDGADRPLGKVSVSSDRVKLKDAAGNETYKIKRKDNGVEIEDAEGNRLFRIKVDTDGSFKLRDSADKTLVKIKKKNDGYEVRTADGRTLAKVKARSGKVVFRSEEGADLGELKRVADARAAMWLAVEPLDLRLRGALVVYYLAVGQWGE